MLLNELGDNEGRQRLLSYVMQLACADTKKIEKAGDTYIRRHMGSYYVGVLLCGVALVSYDKGFKVLKVALTISRQADLLGHNKMQSWMNTAHSERVKLKSPATKLSIADKTISLKY
jgi:hypothetical protein